MTTPQVTNRPKYITRLGQYVDEFYEGVRRARQEGAFVAWCDGIPIPFPLLVAMGIPYVYGEAFAATSSAKRLEKRLQEIASDLGFMPEICSYTRTAMGAAYMSEEEKDRSHPVYQMPKPNLVIVADPGCSTMTNWGNAYRQLFGVPMFVLHTPHLWYGDADQRAAIIEATKQLEELVAWLEDMTHRKLDWDRLEQIMLNVKETAQYRYESSLMSRIKPAPMTFFDFAVALGAVNYLIGKPECATYYRDLRDELADRAAGGIGSVADEKYRLYWDGIMCWPKSGHLARKLASYNAAAVAGRYTHHGFYHRPDLVDTARPLESMAANLVTMHVNQNPDQLIELVSQLCVECSIDGLLMVAHPTCRALSAPQLEVMEGVSKQLGIPGVFIEADMADETYYSDAQVDTRLQELLETIDSKRR